MRFPKIMVISLLVLLAGVLIAARVSLHPPTLQKSTTESAVNQEEQRLLAAPDSDQKYIDLANFYRSQERNSESEQMSKKAIELNPENPTPYLQLGNLYRYTKRFD